MSKYSELSIYNNLQDTVILSELLEDAYLYYILANLTEKQQIITTIFSELKLFGDTLDYKCKNGFRVFENRKTLLCELNRGATVGLIAPQGFSSFSYYIKSTLVECGVNTLQKYLSMI